MIPAFTNVDLYVAAAISCLVFVALQLARPRPRNLIRERLAADSGRGRGASHSVALTDSLVGQATARSKAIETLDRELRRAGWYRATARQEFLAVRNAMAIIALIVTGTICVILGPARESMAIRTLGIGAIVAALGWSLPRVYLRGVGNARVRRIRRGLPDALDLMTMCLTGGLSLPEAFAHAAREIRFAHPDLAMELLIVREQSEMRSPELAFQQLSSRIDAPEIVSLSSLITQGLRLGTDVVSSIREYADTMRTRRRQTADERSNKAGVKLLFPLTMCLLPSVFIILWGPAVLDLVQRLQEGLGPGN